MAPVALTREQRTVVASDAHALAVHAGAGTGKTLTLAHRVVRFAPRGDARAQARTLVVTFTRDATASLHRKLALLLGRDHLVRVLSFHQWAARELPREERRFLDEGEARKILERLLRSAEHATLARALGEDPVGRAASVLGFAKNRELAIADAVARGPFAQLASWSDALQALTDAYERAKGERLDYDDVPVRLRDRLRSSREERDRITSAIDHLFVDEYQDVNGVQHETVRLVALPRGGPSVTVVGDTRQSIYAFRGGSPEHLASFHEPFMMARRSTRVLGLTRNFRATRRLIDAANAVDARSSRFPMRAPSGARAGAIPRLVTCHDGLEEGQLAADEAERLLATNVDAHEIAFLARARYLAQPLVDELRRRDLAHLRVATIHGAKGLEWDHVWLLGAREGGLPSDQAFRAPSEVVRAELLAEERRLMYVAVTRARKTFTASYAGRKSRFLDAWDESPAQAAPRLGTLRGGRPAA